MENNSYYLSLLDFGQVELPEPLARVDIVLGE
jgi:hypothetical protein